MLPSLASSGIRVKLTDFAMPLIDSAASGKMSLTPRSLTVASRSTTHLPASSTRSAKSLPINASGSPPQMRPPAALQVTTLPAGSRVMTPFDMLCSMESL